MNWAILTFAVVTSTYAGLISKSTQTNYPPLRVPIDALESFCDAKSDGTYGFGCNKFKFECYKGKGTQVDCPSGLYYDEKAWKCAKKQQVAACSPVTKTQLFVDCEFASYGSYGLHECSNRYIECGYGGPTPQTCRRGLYFNPDSGYCGYPENIALCKKRSCEPRWFFSECRVDYTPPQKANLDIFTPVKKLTCVNQAFGIFPVSECSRFYYECRDNGITVHKCVNDNNDLFFNLETKVCAKKEDVSGCKELNPTESSYQFEMHFSK